MKKNIIIFTKNFKIPMQFFANVFMILLCYYSSYEGLPNDDAKIRNQHFTSSYFISCNNLKQSTHFAPRQNFIKGKFDIEMVKVQGGTFTMGCTSEQGKDCEDFEKPAHQVTVDDFYIGKFEITQKLWKAVMGTNPSYFTECDDCPVEQVNWDDIRIFLKRLNDSTGKNYRLPTEAEWEFAARGGNLSKGFKFVGSNNLDDVAWYVDNSKEKTHPVGQKQPNELGIYDMGGNVREWCSDWFYDYSNSNQVNPTGPTLGTLHVLRGGSWSKLDFYCRTTYRIRNSNVHRDNNNGLRLVLSETP